MTGFAGDLTVCGASAAREPAVGQPGLHLARPHWVLLSIDLQRRVRVVAVVVSTPCAFHDPAVRVGKAFLGAVFGNAEVAPVAPALGVSLFSG